MPLGLAPLVDLLLEDRNFVAFGSDGHLQRQLHSDLAAVAPRLRLQFQRQCALRHGVEVHDVAALRLDLLASTWHDGDWLGVGYELRARLSWKQRGLRLQYLAPLLADGAILHHLLFAASCKCLLLRGLHRPHRN